MKKLLGILIAIIFSLILFIHSPIAEARTNRTSSSDVYIKGYTKKNGSYVSPHFDLAAKIYENLLLKLLLK